MPLRAMAMTGPMNPTESAAASMEEILRGGRVVEESGMLLTYGMVRITVG